MSRGIFITFEGGEGSGKTTLLKRLESALAPLVSELVMTREPGGSARAEALRGILLAEADASDDMSAATEALIINAARADHVDNVIRPALERGAVILCDRFADSTRAYQGGSVDSDDLEAVIRVATRGVEPDLTLLLDGDPRRLLERRVQRAGPDDRFEIRDLSFHDQVRGRFLAIAEANPARVALVDAEMDAEAVFSQAWTILTDRFAPLSEAAGASQ